MTMGIDDVMEQMGAQCNKTTCWMASSCRQRGVQQQDHQSSQRNLPNSMCATETLHQHGHVCSRYFLFRFFRSVLANATPVVAVVCYRVDVPTPTITMNNIDWLNICSATMFRCTQATRTTKAPEAPLGAKPLEPRKDGRCLGTTPIPRSTQAP